ncbi:mechanosensitive ion channel domain-containing protein [Anabaena cylindrica UHCC 0172]|uniref:mechanosensitive ion channel family protein n=1 Tax=Anabaena cylindrica TaxID=1165 RepID=UPI002B218606|nr:mechanosensitive ion channel domain-containing protein [Anabaena cylindrica]MEA5552808.1 mechanosensitive ion channel domain-containing protein [Anabaena cylindrica UHCC 0172]
MNEIITNLFLSPQVQKVYTQIIIPYQKWIIFVSLLMAIDILFLIGFQQSWLKYIEIPLGISISIIFGMLASRLFDQTFNFYLLELATKQRLNGELLIVINIIAKGLISIIIFCVFAQTHQINLLGLLTSLGIGGLAFAFAAKQALQQLLGGVVIYIDRPFVVDDYIGLPDGTFGKVESIGLRSTKIRNSGKGTLTIVPNDSLIQLSIENFTGGRKVVSLIYLKFSQKINENERALIRQVILESSKDLFGIDSRNTEVTFKDIFQDGKSITTQAQISFFILGAGDIAMDMRHQLLDIAKQNITTQLQEFGIDFEVADEPVNIDAPITI